MVFLGSVGALVEVFFTIPTVKYTGNLQIIKRLDKLAAAIFQNTYAAQLAAIKAPHRLKSDWDL